MCFGELQVPSEAFEMQERRPPESGGFDGGRLSTDRRLRFRARWDQGRRSYGISGTVRIADAENWILRRLLFAEFFLLGLARFRRVLMTGFHFTHGGGPLKPHGGHAKRSQNQCRQGSRNADESLALHRYRRFPLILYQGSFPNGFTLRRQRGYGGWRRVDEVLVLNRSDE